MILPTSSEARQPSSFPHYLIISPITGGGQTPGQRVGSASPAVRDRHRTRHAPAMPSSLYVPVLIAGMLVTVSPPLCVTCAAHSPAGLQQLALEQVAGACRPRSVRRRPHAPCRTCNASRTATTPTQHTVCCMNSPSGRLSRCSVRPPPVPCMPTLTRRNRPRQSERCSVRPFSRLCACAALTTARCTCLSSGFLPVIYSLVRARRQTQPLRLPSDSEEEPAAGAKPEIPQARLRGWKLLLLWFPAACDLTGTTVRPSTAAVFAFS